MQNFQSVDLLHEVLFSSNLRLSDKSFEPAKIVNLYVCKAAIILPNDGKASYPAAKKVPSNGSIVVKFCLLNKNNENENDKNHNQ